MYIPYVYRLTNVISGMYYIGSRTAKGCHPNDGYKSSSKIVKPLYTLQPEQWIKTIIYMGTTKEEVVQYETDLLHKLDCKNDAMSYNQHNGDGKFIVKAISEEAKKKMSKAKKGKSTHNKGKPHSNETRKKISDSLQGFVPWNKGLNMAEYYANKTK